MTPAEKRVKELLDRWLTSLDLHLQYVDLKDSAYNNVQPWPIHDRPTRWVLEHAKQKALELQAVFDSRSSIGDAKFAEAMELIVFLANLVGIQHVQRFIPLADPDRHGVGTLTELDGLKPVKPTTAAAVGPAPANVPVVNVPIVDVTVAMPIRAQAPATHAPTPIAPKPAPTIAPPAASPMAPPMATAAITKSATMDAPAAKANADNEATREMPRPARSATPEATANKQPLAARKPEPPPEAKASRVENIQVESEVHNLVINDAVRLLNWGRRWHELAELIARIADRPKLQEIRRILRSHRAAIELRAAAESETEEKEKPKDKAKDKAKEKG